MRWGGCCFVFRALLRVGGKETADLVFTASRRTSRALGRRSTEVGPMQFRRLGLNNVERGRRSYRGWARGDDLRYSTVKVEVEVGIGIEIQVELYCHAQPWDPESFKQLPSSRNLDLRLRNTLLTSTSAHCHASLIAPLRGWCQNQSSKVHPKDVVVARRLPTHRDVATRRRKETEGSRWQMYGLRSTAPGRVALDWTDDELKADVEQRRESACQSLGAISCLRLTATPLQEMQLLMGK